MSEGDVATFLTLQTMVDGIVLTAETGSCHELQCKVIPESYTKVIPRCYTDNIVEHLILLVQDKPVLSKWEGCEPR